MDSALWRVLYPSEHYHAANHWRTAGREYLPALAPSFPCRHVTAATHTDMLLLAIVSVFSPMQPNQLFAQLFVLAPIPGGAGGGMYVKVDAFRSVAAGAGRAALNDQDPSGMGKGFVEQYYKVYAAGRAGLAGLYRPHSVLVVEGQRYEGRDAIMQKLTMTENRVEKDKVVDKPMASGQHKMGTLDAVQLPDCVVVLVTGMMLLHGETNAIAFAQAFQLMRDASGPYVSNEVFMFNYAG